MWVGVLTAEFRLPQASTLKDKRSVVKSMLQRAAQRFFVSTAEVGLHDDHRRALVAAAVVSREGVHGRQVLDAVLAFAESAYPVQLVDASVEER